MMLHVPETSTGILHGTSNTPITFPSIYTQTSEKLCVRAPGLLLGAVEGLGFAFKVQLLISSQTGSGLFLTQPDNPNKSRTKRYIYFIDKTIRN
ncbi:hypothetical protein D3C86_1818070 [compost metagenome]